MKAAAPSDAILARLLSLHPKIIDLVLDRVWWLLGELGNPQDSLPPVIHVAGTNGKGSTVAMIRAGLEGTGERVHAYTSPHLVRFHERIRLAGELIPESQLSTLLEECEAVNGERPITFFEITTCAALLAFARVPADHVLLEVGLGGRLDATNVVARPQLTVITPVSIDHRQYLGNTLEEIAAEKAGILKRGVPCIVGPQEDAARAVIEDRAARVGAALKIHGQDWMVRTEHGRLVYEDEAGLLDLPLPVLPGAHQIGNAGMAIAALRAIGTGNAEAAVTRAEWPARMQRLTRGPLAEAMAGRGEIWLDGGHNPAAGEALAAHFDRPGAPPLWLIAGMLDTKDQAEFLAPFAGLAAGLRTVTIPDTPASVPAEDLAAIGIRAGLSTAAAVSVEAALAGILERTQGPLRVLVCGSLYLAGTVLAGNG